MGGTPPSRTHARTQTRAQVEPRSEVALMAAVARLGPVAVSIDAAAMGFKYFAGARVGRGAAWLALPPAASRLALAALRSSPLGARAPGVAQGVPPTCPPPRATGGVFASDTCSNDDLDHAVLVGPYCFSWVPTITFPCSGRHAGDAALPARWRRRRPHSATC